MGRVLSCLVLALVAAASWAQDAGVRIEKAWVRAMVPGQQSTAAYMLLTAREPLQLVEVATAAAGVAEVHEMRLEGDVMKMRAHDALPLAPGRTVELRPGSYHVMLMDLPKELKAGTRVQLTLGFRDARGAVRRTTIEVPVRTAPP